MVYSAEQGADCVITIDADLQQDIEAVPRFLEKYSAAYVGEYCILSLPGYQAEEEEEPSR